MYNQKEDVQIAHPCTEDIIGYKHIKITTFLRICDG